MVVLECEKTMSGARQKRNRPAARRPGARRTQPARARRQEKIAAVRKQVEAGTYDVDGKLDAAVDRLIEELLS